MSLFKPKKKVVEKENEDSKKTRVKSCEVESIVFKTKNKN